MAQQTFTPTSGSTHGTFRTIFNANAVDIETRVSGIEGFTGAHQHVVADITDIAANYAALSHQHTATDIDSAVAPSGYVITADGSGNATWEESQGGGGNAFSLVTVTTPTYTQIPQHTHHNYDDTGLGGESGSGSGSGSGGACMVVELLDPTLHVAVTTHKKIGASCDVLLLPPSGCTIDGIISDGSGSGYVLTSQYEAVSIYSDGVSGYYIQ